MFIDANGLFRDFTSKEAEEMQLWAVDAVQYGKIAHPDPEWVTKWLTTMSHDKAQRLLTISCVMVQKVLLSLVLHPVKPGATPQKETP